jgi:protease-4
MPEKEKTRGCLFGGFWRVIDGARRVAVNMVFLILVVVLVTVLLPDRGPDIHDGVALVVSPRGRLVEERTGDPMRRAVNRLLDREQPDTLLKDLVDGIEAATVDDRVTAMLLDLSLFGGASLSKLQEVADAMNGFRSAGKKIIATADMFSQSDYYLAAHADEIYMRREGLIVIEGYGVFRRYYRDGIDRLGVDVNVFRVGRYKSYTEPYERNDMSDSARQASLEWMNDLWGAYLRDVATARKIDVESLADFVENFDDHLGAAGGQASKAALDAGLIDFIAPRDRVRERLIELVGEDEDNHTYHRVGLDPYLESLDQDRFGENATGDLVGVVVARGEIRGGSRAPGSVGGASTSSLIRRARFDDDVKAVVLRVDSPGGLMNAAEEIRRELELTREAGKPVVVSMGSVAASGGYHISMASDEIWASANTLTGSIGVFAVIPTFQRPMAEYFGIHVDGVGTTAFSGALRVDRVLSDEVREMMQSGVEWAYGDFLRVVAVGRGMTPEEVDEVAQGRVWSGLDALDLGLVDKIGDLDDAIASAASRANAADDYEVKYIRKELDAQERMLVRLLGWVGRFAQRYDLAISMPRSDWLAAIESEVRNVAGFDDRYAVIEHSMLEVD